MINVLGNIFGATISNTARVFRIFTSNKCINDSNKASFVVKWSNAPEAAGLPLVLPFILS